MDESGEWIVGNHQLRFEPPDIHWAIVRGWITKEDGEKWVELLRDMTSTGPVYCVVRMTPMPGFPQPRLSQEARQLLAKHASSDWFKAMVYVGGGLLQHITAKGLTVAMLLSGKKRFDVQFVKDDDEARQWIKAHRSGGRR
ncbi:STAS/SEC14 domain-containing protein [Pyxidicoccus parkwayensis]|uniref:STAS/SEC14 domain-containing protein n=1 Tax=Pyxidicoccus parkwayensis TaxID=2813578 RepID=A0ABX7P5G9_9BACT|nr:STAS/SEC14 domain-containing protein [Pyxidicoccus parkwaysis]QSQ25665.1 STAS/SEC14 domain-containing protein [Pyxidicoccus parkwaysis]